MLGTADVVMLAGGELRPAEPEKQTQCRSDADTVYKQ